MKSVRCIGLSGFFLRMRGTYVYGDLCTGRIRGLKRNGTAWQNSLLLDSPLTITSFGEDEAGEIYLTDYSTGDIYRITGPGPGDFDGDGKTDIALYRGTDGGWYIMPSGGSPSYAVGWGGDVADKPVAGDYDEDGKADVAIYRAGNGVWYIIPSSTGTPYGVAWGGGLTDRPVPGDYDGDGKADVAIYRDGGWFIIPSSTGLPFSRAWGGVSSDIPLGANIPLTH